ncbi:MAG: DUF3553 domain-containing protein [Rhodospirillaceae bacterium]|nr:DUF3553 domain-containing protein [Rhodospirillaceae bacterium]
MIMGVHPALAPGTLVRHPEAPAWGIGRVKSAAGQHVMVEFEHAGLQLINIELVTLQVITPDGRHHSND